MTFKELNIALAFPDEERFQHLAAKFPDSKAPRPIARFSAASGVVPDAIVFDLAAFGHAVFAQIDRWKSQYGDVFLVAVLPPDDAEMIPDLALKGVSGFLLNDPTPVELSAVCAAVRAGGHYFSSALVEALFSRVSRAVAAVGLTLREQQILRLIAVNMSNKDIARKLDLSVRTVETHRLNIRKKTNAGNWRELAAVAEKLGLLGEEFRYRTSLAQRPAAPGFHED